MDKDNWIKISDTLPEQIGDYLVYNAYESWPHKTEVLYFDGKEFREIVEEGISEGSYLKLTHWMYLPSPPNTK